MPRVRPRALAMAALAPMLGTSCAEQSPPPSTRVVRVLSVPDPIEASEISFPGRAQAAEYIDLGFEVAGRMIERPAGLGDRVERDQALARLDQRDFRADLDRAKATRDRTAKQLKRVREAATSGAVSKQDLSDAEAEAEEALATYEVRRKALEDSTLRAPFGSVVAATYVEAFQDVEKREAILRLLKTSTMEMWIQVPESRINRVRKGAPAALRFDAVPGRVIEGSVFEIGREADDQTRTFPVSIRFAQTDDQAILPGMAGEASLRLDQDQAAARAMEVPLSAVFSDEGDRSFAWVLDPSGSRVERRDVETGALTESGILIVGGLRPGEKVVVSGGQFLSQGSAVRAIEAAETRS
jgi:RND family efflux transporter MFP subunit